MGYSPGIIYHYFNNKDEIIEAILFESYEKY
ncbi:TetR family transcriptional regulator [endosymbiont 'TC1' of Trimyema compressum]|nr:TetR/AcrR family transcriptional regulator [endosymbiont 'TC1' of Trimyema compressum]